MNKNEKEMYFKFAAIWMLQNIRCMWVGNIWLGGWPREFNIQRFIIWSQEIKVTFLHRPIVIQWVPCAVHCLFKKEKKKDGSTYYYKLFFGTNILLLLINRHSYCIWILVKQWKFIKEDIWGWLYWIVMLWIRIMYFPLILVRQVQCLSMYSSISSYQSIIWA